MMPDNADDGGNMLRFFLRLAVAYVLEQLLGHLYKAIILVERTEDGWRLSTDRKYYRLGGPLRLEDSSEEVV